MFAIGARFYHRMKLPDTFEQAKLIVAILLLFLNTVLGNTETSIHPTAIDNTVDNAGNSSLSTKLFNINTDIITMAFRRPTLSFDELS